MLGFIVVVCAVFVVRANAAGFGFAYEGILGPEHWKENYSKCSGKYQSPINIDSKHVNRTVFPKLKMEGFSSTDGNATFTNNGHTAMMTYDSKTIRCISGGPLNGKYYFSQLHFHWGNTSDHGSEDTINGKCYTMEGHMVFYKAEYLNATAALDHPDGLCVLAILFEVSKVRNKNYDGFCKVLSQITKAGTQAKFILPPSLASLLPCDTHHYYTYHGSLTTPPCLEIVTWIDLEEPVKLSEEQLRCFRALHNEEDQNMSNNFRAVQPTGDRKVLYNLGP